MATPLLISDFLDRFGKHAATSEAMAGKTNMDVIPQYGFQTGYDFQENFPGLNPKISSGLAAGYQTLQEGARALLDGPGGVTLKDALETAKNQTAQNIEGILASASGNITAEQLANRNAYLANQGFQIETPRQSSSFGSMNNSNVYGTNRTEDQLAMDREIATKGIMDNPELLDKFDRSPASSGLRQTIGSRITEGLGSIRDKIGGGLDFLKNLSPVGNILNTVKRGDESTRGIAGLNIDDVFNINRFGTEEDPTKDPYGINIVSGFGNYNEYVKNKAQQLAKMQFKTKTGKQRQKFYEDAAEKIRAEERRKEAARRAAIDRAQREFYASDDPGRGPQNNPQGGLGRQDYSRAPSSSFADLAEEMGIR